MKSNAFKMVMSFSALTFFILISTASFFVELFNSNIGDDKFFDRKSEYLGNDVYKETVEVTINNEIQERSVITGKKNSKGIWDGTYRRDDYDYSISAKHIVEEGVMVNGVRHGKWNYIDKGLEIRCYDMGKVGFLWGKISHYS
jgi:hypothetical protein